MPVPVVAPLWFTHFEEFRQSLRLSPMLRKAKAQFVLVLLSQTTVVWAQPGPPAAVDLTEDAPAPVLKAGNQPAKEGAPAATPDPPKLQHAPAASANTGDDFVIHATLTHPELVRAALLSYRVADESTKVVAFQRSSADDYVAVVPESDLHGEVLQYWITLQLVSGATLAGFNSEQNPHRVQIVPSATDLNEQALLARVDGRRNVFAAMGEYVDFGHSQTTSVTAAGNPQTQTVRDWYYRMEASYTYRPLRLVSEFSLRVGVVRGVTSVPYAATDLTGKSLGNLNDVGLNYAAPTVRFRLSDVVYADGTFLTSVTEVGFSTGAGAALLLGDPYGTNLTLGCETIQVFGTRLYSRMDIAVHPRVRVSPIIEVSDMPHADKYGVRLLGETTVKVAPGMRVGLRGGYQARKFDSGGASFGGSFAYEL